MADVSGSRSRVTLLDEVGTHCPPQALKRHQHVIGQRSSGSDWTTLRIFVGVVCGCPHIEIIVFPIGYFVSVLIHTKMAVKTVRQSELTHGAWPCWRLFWAIF